MPELSPNAPRPHETQLFWASAVTTPVGVGSTSTDRYYLGRADEAGLLLRSITGTVSTLVAQSAVSYYTFRPFVTTVADSTATIRYLGTSRGTNAYKLLADVVLRLHDEEFLNQPLVKGTSVGVEVTTTSGAAGVPAAVKITFQAGLVRHGR